VDGEKCPPYTPPNPVVDPDINTPGPATSWGRDAGIQHGRWLPCKITEEAEKEELWKLKWWDDSQEDRTKSESELRPFEEAGWWYRIKGKTLAKRCQHCRNTDGTEGQWRTREEWTPPADWNKKRGSTRCMECQVLDGDGEMQQNGGPRLKERGRESLPQTVLLCLHERGRECLKRESLPQTVLLCLHDA
jgi:hypothetical protein